MSNTCSRCGGKAIATTMSKFNTEIICMDCATEERKAPGYKAADAAELAAIRQGNYNFPGVGLSQEDSDFLLKARVARGQVKP